MIGNDVNLFSISFTIQALVPRGRGGGLEGKGVGGGPETINSEQRNEPSD